MDNLRIERKKIGSINFYEVVDGRDRVPGGPYECRQVAEQVLVAERSKKQSFDYPRSPAKRTTN